MGNSYQGPLETILFSFNTKELNSFMFQKKRKNTNIYINSPPPRTQFQYISPSPYDRKTIQKRQTKQNRKKKRTKKRGEIYIVITQGIYNIS